MAIIVGNDERFGLMRALTLARVVRGGRLLNGMQPAGPPFAARMIVVRVEGGFEDLRADTGHFETVEAAEAIAARHLGSSDLLGRRRITGGEGSYLDAPLDLT